MNPDDHRISVEEAIGKPFFGRPHVVILGAGASRAAFPDGDATGRRLRLVADLVDDVKCKFISENPVPRTAAIEELWEWHIPLIEAEVRTR